MSINDVLALTISSVSLLISFFVGFKSYRLSEYQLRLTTRIEFQKLLLDLSKALVNDPDLWSIYDSYPLSPEKKGDINIDRKIQAYAYMKLNTFEAVFAFYSDSKKLTSAEKESFRAWKEYLCDVIRGSSRIRSLAQSPITRKIYHANLIEEIETILSAKSLA